MNLNNFYEFINIYNYGLFYKTSNLFYTQKFKYIYMTTKNQKIS